MARAPSPILGVRFTWRSRRSVRSNDARARERRQTEHTRSIVSRRACAILLRFRETRCSARRSGVEAISLEIKIENKRNEVATTFASPDSVRTLPAFGTTMRERSRTFVRYAPSARVECRAIFVPRCEAASRRTIRQYTPFSNEQHGRHGVTQFRLCRSSDKKQRERNITVSHTVSTRLLLGNWDTRPAPLRISCINFATSRGSVASQHTYVYSLDTPKKRSII